MVDRDLLDFLEKRLGALSGGGRLLERLKEVGGICAYDLIESIVEVLRHESGPGAFVSVEATTDALPKSLAPTATLLLLQLLSEAMNAPRGDCSVIDVHCTHDGAGFEFTVHSQTGVFPSEEAAALPLLRRACQLVGGSITVGRTGTCVARLPEKRSRAIRH
jgi:hypothetical protein